MRVPQRRARSPGVLARIARQAATRPAREQVVNERQELKKDLFEDEAARGLLHCKPVTAHPALDQRRPHFQNRIRLIKTFRPTGFIMRGARVRCARQLMFAVAKLFQGVHISPDLCTYEPAKKGVT